MEVSQAEAAPAAKKTDFERQNPASEQLLIEINKVFDEALGNLAKDIKEFLKEAANADDQ